MSDRAELRCLPDPDRFCVTWRRQRQDRYALGQRAVRRWAGAFRDALILRRPPR